MAIAMFLVLSPEGYGWLVQHFAGVRLDRYQRLAVALGVWVAIGGVLNLVHGMSVAVGRALPLCGMLGLVFADWRSIRRDWKREIVFWSLICLWGIYWARPTFANVHDDFHAYFVYPTRLLQEGTLTFDRWSERAVFSLGGMPFLQSILLSWKNLSQIAVVDVVLGFALLASALMDVATRHRAWWGWAASGMCVVFFSILPRANASALVLIWATLFVLVCWMSDTRFQGKIYLALWGLVLGAALSLKSNSAVVLFGMAFGQGLLVMREQGVRAGFRSWSWIAVGALLSAGTWMVAHFEMYQTFLFPILGKGLHVSATNPDYPLRYWNPSIQQWLELMGRSLFSFSKLLWFLSPLAWTWWSAKSKSKSNHSLSTGYRVLLVVLFFYYPMLCGVAGPTVDRYGWPLEMLLHGAVWAEWIRMSSFWKSSFQVRVAWVVLSAVWIFGFQLVRPVAWRGYMLHEWTAMGGLNLSNEAVNKVREAQLAIPAGARAVAHLEMPFHLDFKRNQWMVVDVPGTVGPPPEMPLFHGFGPLRDYLLNHGFTYLLYAYKSEANFPKAAYGSRRTDLEIPISAREDARRVFAFHDLVEAQRKSKFVVFDKDGVVALDLRRAL